jgi:transcriptional regulator with XRE-family HTH domain
MSDASVPDRAAESGRADKLLNPDDINTRKEFLHAFHALCAVRGLSVRELVDQIGMHPATAIRLYHGRHLPRAGIFRRLLEELQLSEAHQHSWIEALARVRAQDRPPASGTVAAEQAARRDLSDAEDALTTTDGLTLPALWKVTHARLDYYHQIATGQARQSFRNAQIAMAVGFLLLVIFAALALTAKSTAGAVVTGALGAVSAAFAAYISRTFVRSQETAAAHLRSYFDQPLEFSRYLAAERLLNSIERLEIDQRATITAEVLRGMLTSQSGNVADRPADVKEPGKG